MKNESHFRSVSYRHKIDSRGTDFLLLTDNGVSHGSGCTAVASKESKPQGYLLAASMFTTCHHCRHPRPENRMTSVPPTLKYSMFVAITSHFPSSVHSSFKHCIEKKKIPQSKILHLAHATRAIEFSPLNMSSV